MLIHVHVYAHNEFDKETEFNCFCYTVGATNNKKDDIFVVRYIHLTWGVGAMFF